MLREKEKMTYLVFELYLKCRFSSLVIVIFWGILQSVYFLFFNHFRSDGFGPFVNILMIFFFLKKLK